MDGEPAAAPDRQGARLLDVRVKLQLLPGDAAGGVEQHEAAAGRVGHQEAAITPGPPHCSGPPHTMAWQSSPSRCRV